MNLEKKENKWAIVTLTSKGVEVSLKIKENLPEKDIDIYTMEKFKTDGVKIYEGSLKNLFENLFKDCSTIVCVMATGIVVRTIAPFIKHKSIDPGVIVLDASGKFVISLLSGHIGNANENSILIADRIGATPVITTASDSLNSISVDEIGKRINAEVENFVAAKNVTSDILENKKIFLNNEAKVELKNLNLPENISENKEDFDSEILITIENKKGDFAKLIPKVLTVGIGCRKNTEAKDIINFVKEVFKENNLNLKAILKFASINLKKDEVGIIKTCEYFKADFEIVDNEKILEIEDRFEPSEFVKKITGVSSVCEGAGFVASNYGEELVKRTAKNGMTLSVWRNK